MAPPLHVGVAVGATARGRSHERRGALCEDVVRTAGGPVAVAALADGAGSARHARRGAEVATIAVVDLLRARFVDLVAGGPRFARDAILSAVDAAIDEEAARIGAALRDLASTLLFVAVDRDRFLAGHLGDGLIGVRRAGRAELLSAPANGEHANETVFVPTRSGDSDLRLYAGATTGVDGFVLLTDGAADGLWGLRPGSTAREPSPVLERWWAGLDTAPPSEVAAAIEAGLRGPVREVTRDDCGVAVVRRVAFGCGGAARSRELLGRCGRRATRTRSRVLRAWSAGGPDTTIQATARRAGLTVTAVVKHLAKLERLGWT